MNRIHSHRVLKRSLTADRFADESIQALAQQIAGILGTTGGNPGAGAGLTGAVTVEFDLVNAVNGDALILGKGTADFLSLGYLPDGVTLDPEAKVARVKDGDTGKASLYLCQFVYPEGDSFTGSLTVFCFNPQFIY